MISADTVARTELVPLASHERCAQEQVQFIGHVQPHGILFALSEPDLVVRQVSSNVSTLLRMIPDSVLGTSFETVLGRRQFDTFLEQVRDNRPLIVGAVEIPVDGYSVLFQCVGYRHADYCIVELELSAQSCGLDPLDIDAHIRIPLARMELATDTLLLAQTAAVELRALTGFDRVLVYRFDDAWNGEVIAEAAAQSAVSYLGSRFPATDIPPQVRQLFLINPLRAIADVNAAPVSIVSTSQKPLDLTRSALRSASPIHLEYLRNMKVQATLTVSIIVRQRLWGMLACHHGTPRRLDRSLRAVSELVGQALASQVALRIDNATLQSRIESRQVLDAYFGDADESIGNLDLHAPDPALLSMFNASELVTCINGVMSHSDPAVDPNAFKPVASSLQRRSTRGIAHSDCLTELDAGLISAAVKAAGALYIGIDDWGDDYLLFLREELVETVTWAGNPQQAVSADSQDQLHPRASFESWHETVRGRSRSWSLVALESAGLMRDRLRRLRDARDLAMANQRLEREVDERRKVEADLKSAKLAADAANQAKSDFLANMSHEIRTPMNGIIGMTELALQTALNHEQQEFLGMVKSSADSLLSLLNDILDFSKIEAGMQDIESIEFNLRETLEDTIKVLGVPARQKGLELACQVFPDVPDALLGDPTRIRQVIINLVGNAIKFTAAGEVVVQVTVIQNLDVAAELLFSVRDTGVGIPASKVKTIFEAFTQADNSVTRRYGGTGLGLAISSRLIQLMGGRIWVESELDQGSNFLFSLKLRVVRPAAVYLSTAVTRGSPPQAIKAVGAQVDIADAGSIDTAHPPRVPARSLNVLLVEDNPVNQMVARRLLEKRGHVVTIADNGRVALEALQTLTPDVIFMDVQMPEINGFEATVEIRRREMGTGNHTLIVAMTAHAMTSDRDRCLKSGMDAYISKPISAKAIDAAIEELMRVLS